MKSPVMILSSLFDDVKRLEPDVKGLDRDLLTVKLRFENEGFSFLSVTLASLCDSLDSGLASGRFACPTSFRKVRGGSIPKFLQGLICKVFDSKTGQLLDRPQISAVKCLREILRLFKKTKLRPSREVLLQKKAVKSFLETDNFISHRTFDVNKVNLFLDVARLVMPNLDKFDMEELKFRHGPGNVAERLRPNQKWSGLLEACQTDLFLASKYGFDILSSDGYSTADHRSIEAASFDDVLYDADVVNGLVPQRAFGGTAKLITVPKDSTSLRTITMEPVLNMFIQQGLNEHLRSNILKCSILSSCLALTDQSKNQNLALLGSLTGEYATIDLSSASDLLGLDLAKLAFAKRPKFLTCALDCRSTHVNTPLGVIRLQKFAGMGNALTFPVQSIVFALLAICGVLCSEGKRPSVGNVRRAAKLVRVYGDDIIVRSEHSRQVCDWITSFGLKVNQKKSFFEGNFRESCGVDAFRGQLVTPVYIRHDPIISAQDPEQIASLVSSSNQCWMLGLYSLSQALRDNVEEVLPLPLVSQRSSALGWHSRVDTNVAQKWDGKLQRLVFRAHTIVPMFRNDRLNGYAALAKFFLSDTHVREYWTKEHLQQSVLRFHTKIRRRWMPATAGL